MTIEEPAEYGEILDRALATPGPVIVEAKAIAPFFFTKKVHF
ncbi:MAG: hypothetical protein V7K41_03535 [Nostoc sp.]